MARHKKYESIEDSNPALDISSLIDVCFLLLIYFIVTSTITPRETDLMMALPGESEGGDPPDIDPMLISVESSGTVYVGAGPSRQQMDSKIDERNLPLLSAQLDLYSSTANAANETPLVQIFVNEDTKQQRVIDVLNALAKYKINSVTFTDLLDD